MITDVLMLLRRIENAFPYVDMPENELLTIHKDDCFECSMLRDEIEAYRRREVDVNLIRLIHMELSNLSYEAICWVLPYYLRYAITSDAEYSTKEVEFLIFFLSPSKGFESSFFEKINQIDLIKIDCLIDFISWIENIYFWQENCGENIRNAKLIINNLKK